MTTERTGRTNIKTYFIPGLGGDKRLFQYQEQHLPFDTAIIEWISPESDTEPLSTYAQRLSQQIDTSQPFNLVGVSMGGLVVQELLKTMQPEKSILISSVKTDTEVPNRIRLLQSLPAYQLIQPTTFKWFNHFSLSPIQFLHPKYGTLFYEMVKAQDPSLIRWQLHTISNWQNEDYPKHLIHIHGTKDRTFPIDLIQGEVDLIQGGSHFMIIKKWQQINERLLWHLGTHNSATNTRSNGNV